MAKVIIYLRVSSSEQTTEDQLPALEKWVADRWHDLVEVYQETESAWKAGHQKELSRLLSDIRDGHRRYDYLVVWSIDRLSRGGVGQIFSLIDTFRRHGCQLVSVKEPWLETSGVAAELLLAVTSWIAKFESDRRSERTRAGLVRAVKEGKHLGRPKGSKDKNKRSSGGYLLRYHKGLNKGAVKVKANSPV